LRYYLNVQKAVNDNFGKDMSLIQLVTIATRSGQEHMKKDTLSSNYFISSPATEVKTSKIVIKLHHFTLLCNTKRCKLNYK